MNYKLYKQLKDAGFRQNGKGEYISFSGNLSLVVDGFIVESGKYYIPTLSELIEACKDLKYFQLTKWNEDDWVASEEVYYDDCGYQDQIGKGKTPKEAVARLWLKLQTDKKK